MYFLGWTVLIALRQKRAWKAYAQKMNLRYTPGKMLDTPEVKGTIGAYTIAIFSGEFPSPDGRSTRKLSSIEINLTTRLPFTMAAASGGMVQIAQQLNLNEEYRPDHPGWIKDYAVLTESAPAAAAYLTAERLDALTGLMKIKNLWVICVLRPDTALLRIDTPLPVDHPGKLDSLVTRLLKAAEKLEARAGEDSLLKKEMARIPRDPGPSARPKAAPSAGLQLELEEDEPPPHDAAPPPEQPDDSASS